MPASFSVCDTRQAASGHHTSTQAKRLPCSAFPRVPRSPLTDPARSSRLLPSTTATDGGKASPLTVATVGFRKDLDRHEQQLGVAVVKKLRHEAQIQSWREDSGLTLSLKAASLKMMVSEAERYQRERKLTYLRETILDRLQSPRGAFKKKKQHQDTSILLKEKSPASMVCTDIDSIMSLPAGALPQGLTPIQAATNAVMALPLWTSGRLASSRSSSTDQNDEA